LLINAARPCRHASGDRWFADEMYVKIAGRWVYLYRAIDQYGQVIDVLVAEKRDLPATRRFFTRALEHRRIPTEVTTDRAPAYPRVLDELLPTACHIMERSACVISTGHAFIQNLRRGHYKLGLDVAPRHRLAAAFAELIFAAMPARFEVITGCSRSARRRPGRGSLSERPGRERGARLATSRLTDDATAQPQGRRG
jgi:hypothetical protein